MSKNDYLRGYRVFIRLNLPYHSDFNDFVYDTLTSLEFVVHTDDNFRCLQDIPGVDEMKNENVKGIYRSWYFLDLDSHQSWSKEIESELESLAFIEQVIESQEAFISHCKQNFQLLGETDGNCH